MHAELPTEGYRGKVNHSNFGYDESVAGASLSPTECPCKKCGVIRLHKHRDASDVRRCNPLCLSCSKLGKTLSEETRAKISRSKLGHEVSSETRQKIGLASKGRSPSTETRAKLSAKARGKRPALGMKHSVETRSRYSEMRKGHPVSEETRKKMRDALHRHHGTAHNPSKPTRRELAMWAFEVLRRDAATCQYCGFKKTKRGTVHAHHVLSKSKWPQLALLVSNGITLCTVCHADHHELNGIV
jgi:5-methylcytosine-specific restriction endonuclease McrA